MPCMTSAWYSQRKLHGFLLCRAEGHLGRRRDNFLRVKDIFNVDPEMNIVFLPGRVRMCPQTVIRELIIQRFPQTSVHNTNKFRHNSYKHGEIYANGHKFDIFHINRTIFDPLN